MEREALIKAIEIAGGQTNLARLINKTQAHISVWVNRDKRVAAEYAIKIEKFTGVPRYELRPDIYPPEEYKQAS